MSNGRFFSHAGNYTDYLLDKAERQEADATIEHKRQMFLKKELAWVRQGPRAQRSKQKDRFERYYDEAAKDGPVIEEDVELVIPPPPQLGNRTVEVSNLGMEIAGKKLFSGFNFTFENGKRVGVCGRNGLGKTTLLKIVIGQLAPTEGTVKTGQLTKFNYVDQGRLQLNEENTVMDEVAEGREFVQWGDAKLSVRSYLKRFLFADERITDAGEKTFRRRTQPAAARAHSEERRQLSHPRRADERSGPADVARAGGGVDRVSRRDVRREPRPLFSQPRLHGHSGL